MAESDALQQSDHHEVDCTNQINGASRRTYELTIVDWLSIAWALCATVSVTSAKHILVARNYHYPMHLLLVNLLITLACVIVWEVVYEHANPIKALSRMGKYRDGDNGRLIGHALPFCSALCASASMPLFMQAILHFPNLATLLILSFVIYFFSSLLLSLQQERSCSAWLIVRLTGLVFAGFTILYDEYRLTVNGMVPGILAILLLFIARASYQIGGDLAETHGAEPQVGKHTFLITLILCTSITCVWCLAEATNSATTSLSQSIPLSILNIASTVLTLACLRSTIIARDTDEATASLDKISSHGNLTRVALILAMAGLCACYSFQFSTSAYLSIWQVLAFVGGCICSIEGFPKPAANRWPVWMSRDENVDVELSSLVDPTREHGIPLLAGARQSLEVSKSSTSSQQPEEAHTSRDTPGDHRMLQKAVDAIPALSAFILASASWTWFLCSSYTAPPHLVETWPSLQPRLDIEYAPPAQIDLVISMFEEPVSEVTKMITQISSIPSIAQREPRILIYNTNPEADIEQLKAAAGAHEVVALSNVGREGRMYLHHISSHWNELARHTIFLQAHIHNPREVYSRIREYFVSETGMLSLSVNTNTCPCNHCGDVNNWEDVSGVVGKLYREVYNRTCDSVPVLLSYKGQFIVSAQRIRANDRRLYQELESALTDPMSWAHKEDYLRGRPDSLNAPFFGYTLERMWSLLFQCSDMYVASHCPTLLSGIRSGGAPADCQCLDLATDTEAST